MRAVGDTELFCQIYEPSHVGTVADDVELDAGEHNESAQEVVEALERVEAGDGADPRRTSPR